MSSLYDGIPSNVTVPSAVAIASSTNATPIVVTTSSPHGLTTGSSVYVYQHNTNTAANGTWKVSVVNSTSIILVGSVGNGVGAGTGYVQDMGYGASVTIPSDGDPATASSVNTPLEGIADRTAFIALNTGSYKMFATGTLPFDDNGTEGSTFMSHTFTSPSTWEPFTTNSGLIATISPNLQAGDIIDVAFTGSCYWTSTFFSYYALLGLYGKFGDPSGSYGTASKLSGSGQRLPTQVTPTGQIGSCGFHLRSQAVVPSGKQAFELFLYGYSGISGAGSTLTVLGDYSTIYTIWRPTSFSGRVG